jgi:RNA polymerase sigma-70 factor (sigma-E family)
MQPAEDLPRNNGHDDSGDEINMAFRSLKPNHDERYRAFVETERSDLVRTAIFLAAGDRWAAEDLVQTALVRLYVAWPRLREDTIGAYARRCLLNAFIDHRRLAFSRRERVHAEPPEPLVEPTPPLDRQSEVFQALAQLPPRMRAAVVMRHLLELTVEETADALDCSLGTVKSQTARGLDQLRRALATEPEPEPEPEPSQLIRTEA